MPTTYKINNEFDSVNLLNRFSQFNESYAWNKVTNPSGATIFNTFLRKFSGKNSCEIAFANTTPIEFNSGNDKMRYAATNTGLHTLRFSAFKSDSVSIMDFTIKCFINSVATDFTTNLSTATGFINGQWNSYWMEIYLVENQLLDFSFIAQTNTIGQKLFIDGLKLSLRDRFIPNSVPFNEPLITDYLHEFVVTLPLLQPGEKIIIGDGRIPLSIIGDFIQLAVISPSPLQNNFQNLFFTQPYITNDYTDLITINNVLFVIKNENSVAFQANPFTVKLLIQK